MAKRKRSYEDNFEPQLKTHVNNKVMQQNNKEQMKIIYDKTRNILFNGARNLPNKMGESNNNNSDKLITDSSVKSDGKLRGQDTTIIKSCNSSISKCYFCDKMKSEKDVVQCLKCDNMFCGNCSLVIYDHIGETYICLSCA